MAIENYRIRPCRCPIKRRSTHAIRPYCKQLRIARHLSQEQLAQMSGLNVRTI